MASHVPRGHHGGGGQDPPLSSAPGGKCDLHSRVVAVKVGDLLSGEGQHVYRRKPRQVVAALYVQDGGPHPP